MKSPVPHHCYWRSQYIYKVACVWDCRSGHVERENFPATWEGELSGTFPSFGRAGPGRAEPSRAGPSPSQTEPSRAEPSRAGPSQVGPSPSQTEPSQAELGQAEGVFSHMLDFSDLRAPT